MTIDTTAELKPCPFCGGTPKAYKEDMGAMLKTSLVRCKCGAEIGKGDHTAVELWNKRYSSPLLPKPLFMDFDAMRWANDWKEAYAYNPAIAADEGAMLAWFSNAIMAGFDEAMRRYTRPKEAAIEEAIQTLQSCMQYFKNESPIYPRGSQAQEIEEMLAKLKELVPQEAQASA